MNRFLAGLILFALVVSLVPVFSALAQTETPPPPEVIQLLSTMSPEEKVGQLFLVTFRGTEITPQSPIYDLIKHRHVGGVVLLAENDNFTAAPNTVPDAHALISTLQELEWEATVSPEVDTAAGQTIQRAYIPLFVGVMQDGDSYPGDQILNGLTPLPNEMAVGATWRTELAQQIGMIQGRELSALGINLYFGPSLDVLEMPNPSARGDIGPRSFGGDPFWVGEMGQAYINGLHSGSGNRMMVVAKHFPGGGGSDRPPEEEVATVRKSLEQLKQIELAPFVAVTGNAPNPFSVADGLLVSHIRYQGLQGNIRATTRPVSFDQQALAEILAIPEFTAWQASGGLMVSDDLGSRAVQDFYAPGNENFSARLVARDAFLAGNDLLYLGNILSDDVVDTYSTVLEVLDFFTQKYREDPTFAQQVDKSVGRILVQKYRIYDPFTLAEVQVPHSDLSRIGEAQDAIFEVARRSTTLISPDPQELTTLLPTPPTIRDQIVFITDTVRFSQCSECPLRYALSPTALEETVIRLYGPNTTGLISPPRLTSFTFNDLNAFLNGTSLPEMEDWINRADWIVLSLSGAGQGQPELISRFLSERQGLVRDKNIILFSFTAPYYLDATDISRLTAYFGLYSKQPASVEAAARLLFQDLTPTGYSPVSIPGTGYDLIEATSPDPDQIISLFLDFLPGAIPTDTAFTQEPTPIPLFGIGDTIAVRTDVIRDHNGNIVPDGTVVQLSMLLSGETGGILQQVDAETIDGISQASFTLEQPGLVEIRASSEPATLSQVIQIDVSSGEPAAVTVIAPVPTETVTPTPIPPTETVEEDDWVTPDGFPRFNSWTLAMLFLAGSAWLAYWAVSRLQSAQWGVRWGLCVLLGGLIGYNYLALNFPGTSEWLAASGLQAILLMTFAGEVLGLGVAWLWSSRS